VAELRPRPHYIGLIYVSPDKNVLSCDDQSVDDVEETEIARSHPSLASSSSTKEFAEEGKLGFGFTPSDELEQVDIGPGDRPRPTWISKNLDPEFKAKLVELLREFPDCFVWEYYEMPGLDRSIVEHRLPIKPGFCPYAQHPRKIDTKILDTVKEEIERMIKPSFIRPC